MISVLQVKCRQSHHAIAIVRCVTHPRRRSLARSVGRRLLVSSFRKWSCRHDKWMARAGREISLYLRLVRIDSRWEIMRDKARSLAAPRVSHIGAEEKEREGEKGSVRAQTTLVVWISQSDVRAQLLCEGSLSISVDCLVGSITRLGCFRPAR